jgi:hypothetical protein
VQVLPFVIYRQDRQSLEVVLDTWTKAPHRKAAVPAVDPMRFKERINAIQANSCG